MEQLADHGGGRVESANQSPPGAGNHRREHGAPELLRAQLEQVVIYRAIGEPREIRWHLRPRAAIPMTAGVSANTSRALGFLDQHGLLHCQAAKLPGT